MIDDKIKELIKYWDWALPKEAEKDIRKLCFQIREETIKEMINRTEGTLLYDIWDKEQIINILKDFNTN